MANKRKNIPKELLLELIPACRGIKRQIQSELACHGYNCSFETLTHYIELYELEEALQLEKAKTAFKAYNNLAQKVDDNENWAISLMLHSIGDSIDFIPNKTSTDYKHKLEIEKADTSNEVLKEVAGYFKENAEKHPHKKKPPEEGA